MEEQRKVFEAQFEALESLGFGDKTKNIQNDRSGSDMDSEEEEIVEIVVIVDQKMVNRTVIWRIMKKMWKRKNLII